MELLSKDKILKERCIATIGYFDGVHQGHDFLLSDLKKEGAKRGLKTLVVTFSNHPRLIFDPDCGLKFITLPDEKIHLLEKSEIDYCLVLPFTMDFARKKSYEFMRELKERFCVDALVVGYDHHFGSDRESQFEDYVRFGKETGVEVLRCEAFRVSDVNVSSSKIREALIKGDIEVANRLLGYEYTIIGEVVHGHEIGRKLGFPTANIKIEPTKLLPANGVYQVKVQINGLNYGGMMNIGSRPTVDNGDISVEVFVDRFNGDLYGKELVIEIVKFIRGEQKFGSLEELKNQLALDLQEIRR